MATTSLRQVAVAVRPVRVSAGPLWNSRPGFRGTRHLSLLAVRSSLRNHGQALGNGDQSSVLSNPTSFSAARSFSLWRNIASSQADQSAPSSQPRPSPAALLSIAEQHLPPPTPTIQQIRHASTQPNPPPYPKPAASLLKKPLATLSALTPHENIYTIPNLLTFSRLLSAPLLGYLLLSPAHPPIQSLLLFTYAGLTDLLDGYLARRLNQHTVVGSIIDPMADKSLMAICTFCLAYTGILPWWTATIILGRDVALALSAIWWRWISLPPPKTMGRYWDFSLPSAEVYPTEISKINTLLQLLLIGNAMVLPVLPVSVVEAGNLWGVFEGWCGLVAGTTVWSGLSYVGNKEAVKIVSQEEVRRVLEERERRALEERGGEGVAEGVGEVQEGKEGEQRK